MCAVPAGFFVFYDEVKGGDCRKNRQLPSPKLRTATGNKTGNQVDNMTIILDLLVDFVLACLSHPMKIS